MTKRLSQAFWLVCGSEGARNSDSDSIHSRGDEAVRATADDEPVDLRVGCTAARVCRGFTLLELLVVMVIIGLLAAYVGPQYFRVVGKSEFKAVRSQMDAFQKALVAYRLDMGGFPPAAAGLNALVTAPPGKTKWAGPYLSKAIPLDPWGNAYVYVVPGKHGEYDIISYGKDGRPGGQGDDADIGSWQ